MSSLAFTVPGPADTTAAAYELGVGRAVPTTAAVLGFVAVVAGGLALTRSRRGARSWVGIALTLGQVSVIVGALHGANSAGGPGTGNGMVGAVLAVALGVAGTALAVSAVVRSHRAVRFGDRPTP
ncbi:DUF6223 family protein [Rhodococcus sp. NPDC047139]|uniref:DUF6223 family protein n=1 Tax=Rhodococcus sp. NPDC047139 TaxID=3155141 RepID=UPI0033D97032